MKHAEHIHTPEDGRGIRQVFVDGRYIDSVFYADTKRGIVKAHRQPIKVDRWRKRIIEKTYRGKVEITFVSKAE